MKFKQFGVLLSVATVFGINSTLTKALAQPEPSIQFLQALGSDGCSVVDMLVGTDGRTLSIFFDNIRAENDKRQRCILRLDTVIPNGFYVQDMQVLYQGSTEVASGSRGTSLSRSYTFVGGAGSSPVARPVTTKFTSTKELFQVEDPLTVASASCGGQGLLGINMIAQSSPGSSIVIDGGIKIHFELAACE